VVDTRTDLSNHVQDVRVSRGNSLSGLMVHEIVELVKNAIIKNQLMRQNPLQHQQQQQFGQQVTCRFCSHRLVVKLYRFAVDQCIVVRNLVLFISLFIQKFIRVKADKYMYRKYRQIKDRRVNLQLHTNTSKYQVVKINRNNRHLYVEQSSKI